VQAIFSTMPPAIGHINAGRLRALAITSAMRYGQHADAWRAGDPNCRHAARLDVDRWPDDVPVPTFGSRMVCTRCGMIGADARPNWKEQPERSGTLAGEGIDKQRVGPSRRCPAGGEH
jgi:hypothetical protein